MPDVLAYLQNETELTRSTLVRILKESGRLGEFFNNPQRFMDAVAAILKYELHRLLVDGIKYERIDGAGAERRMGDAALQERGADQLPDGAARWTSSVYEYVVYDSEVEREFARQLDEREDIKLFVKLPGWFEIDTPVGKYNPDWAILKHDGQAALPGARDQGHARLPEAAHQRGRQGALRPEALRGAGRAVCGGGDGGRGVGARSCEEARLRSCCSLLRPPA